MNIGNNIHKLRTDKGISQAELARRTGLKREYICRLEGNGGRKLDNPTIKTLSKVASGLGVSLVQLLGGMESTDEVKEFRGMVSYLESEINAKNKFIDDVALIVADLLERLNTIKKIA